MKKIVFSVYFFTILQFVFSNESLLPSSNVIPDSIKANECLKKGKVLFYEKPDSCRYFLKKAASLYKKNGIIKNEEIAYHLLGISYSMNGIVDSAEYYAQKSIEASRILQDSLGLAFNINNLGLIYLNNSKYMKGSMTLIKCLKIKEELASSAPELKEKLDLSSTLHNLGVAFHKMEDLKKSDFYYQKAIEALSKGDIQGKHLLYTDIALLYKDMKRYDESYMIYNELIKENAFEENLLYKAKLYNNFGDLLSKMGDYDEAFKYAQQAYIFNMRMSNKQSTAKSLNLLAELSLSKKEYAFASDYAEKAYEIADENHYLTVCKTSAKIISDANKKLNNYKKAFKYKDIELKLSNSLFKTDENRIVRELETKYNSKKNKQEIALLNAQKKITTLELRRKDIRNTFLTVILFISLIGIFSLSYLSYKNYMQRKLLKKNNEKLNFLNQQMEKMLAIISHDMRGFMGGFKSVSSLIPYYIERGKTEELIRLTQLLTDKTNNIEELLNSLLEWAVTQSGFYKTTPEPLLIKEIVDQQIKLMSDFVTQDNVVIENKIPKDTILKFDKNSFVFIVRNLLSNAIKFTPSGYIRFNFKTESKQAIFSISDTGMGIPEEMTKNIFNMKYVKSMYPERIEGGGLGLKLVKDFVDLNGGTIFVESKINKGTTFNIKIKDV